MASATFVHRHRVTYSECTLGNHIYYARHLDLLEEARGEFFRHIGQPLRRWQEAETIFPVIECRVRYRAAARYDDMLAIEVWLTELARVRMECAYRIVNEAGTEIITALTQHACTTPHDKLKRLPEELAAALRPFVRPPARIASPDISQSQGKSDTL